MKGTINANGNEITVISEGNENDYISLTDAIWGRTFFGTVFVGPVPKWPLISSPKCSNEENQNAHICRCRRMPC